ncbi:MAG: DUF1624 domain-containing protein [Lachnospiraceae bacterium]|nr:DUF1624 domain-containing protein [Lachnospiraceae bacterium]
MKNMRYVRLDNFRGATLISMMIYHLVWDLVYIYGKNWNWYESRPAYVWQQSICWSFIFLSGFCWSLGSRPLRRGLIVFGGGMLVTIVTMIFMPEQRVVFGILTFLGSAMLLLTWLDKYWKKVNAKIGLLSSIVLFLWTKEINSGYLGFGRVARCRLPLELYRNVVTTYLGFPDSGFYSTDYFSLFPWIFLFFAGYFFYRIVKEAKKMELFIGKKIPIVGDLGRYSLLIYLLHQPFLYLLLQILNLMDII